MSGVEKYLATIAHTFETIECTYLDTKYVPLDSGMQSFKERVAELLGSLNKIMLIGNGGSMGIASHCAIDLTKNCGIAAIAFSDASALTCVSNDLGYECVFSRQIEVHSKKGDLLIAISSSGESPNILKGVDIARSIGCEVVTLSGFESQNSLRRKGDINFYVSSSKYGMVEITHLALLHAIIDWILSENNCGAGF